MKATGLVTSSVAVDRHGSIWFAGNGVDRFDGTYWTNFSKGQVGASYGDVRSIAFDADNNAWLTTSYYANVARISGNEITIHYPSNTAFPGPEPKLIAIGHDSSIWIAQSIHSGGGITRYKGDRSWHYNTGNSTLPDNDITSLAVSPTNMVYVGTATAGLGVFDGSAPLDETSAAPAHPAIVNAAATGTIAISPNPAGAEAIIHLTAPSSSRVQVSLYDNLGREVAALLDARSVGAAEEIRLNTADLPAGPYFVRMTTDAGTITQPLLVAQ
jgi:hypothetical protein